MERLLKDLPKKDSHQDQKSLGNFYMNMHVLKNPQFRFYKARFHIREEKGLEEL